MPWWAWILIGWNIMNSILIEILHLTTPGIIWRRDA